MPVAKFGCKDRSEKLAAPACSRIFLMLMGIIGAAAGAGALAVILPARGLFVASLAAAVLPAGAAGAGGAVCATGSPPGTAGATTVAPGPAITRVTFKVRSGSMMTRAYSLRAVT